MKRLVFSVFAALALAGFSSAAAQTPAPRFEDRVVVTPNRSDSPLDNAPAFITLLDEDDIARSTAHDLPDLLRQAGMNVTDVTGNGRSYRVDLRGFGATAGLNTLVLVDGRPINQPDLSGTDWFLVPLERVVKVEVIRGGGAAVTYGDNASGGVVNIVTTAAAAGRQSTVALRGGSYETFTSDAVTRGTAGKTNYSVSARYSRSDGYRDNSQTEGGDVGGSVAFPFRDRFEMAVSGGYHGDNTGLPGALLQSELASGIERTASVHPDDFADVDDGYVMFTPKATLGELGYASVDVSIRKRNSSFFSSFVGGQFTGDTGTRTIAASPRVVLTVSRASMTHHLVGGFDVSSAKEDISNEATFDGTSNLAEFALTKNNWGGYVQDELRAGKLALTAGYRFDSVDYTFVPDDPAVAPDASEQAGNIGAVVALSPKASAFGRVSRSFRYPVLDELFDFGSNALLNVVPQHSIDFEGGVRFEAGSVRGSLSAFRTTTEDEIFFNPIGGGSGFGANENIDGSTVRTGFEAEASTEVRRILLSGTITALDASIEDGLDAGSDVPGVADFRATFQAS
ncbi:MAG TPA: TonB-dependent receptor, partial [Vicinamibacterales bacterium]|nr:TonB-dependent receptor [Vicinamibacterales bacterium]